jgi:rod shape-determining protein MreD
MTRARVLAAITVMLTALLLQATVIAPLTLPVPISLPAVLIAATALVDGPGSGIAFGFSAGLLADLASRHPAGVFALCWMTIGLLCGLAADRATPRRDAAIAALVCALVAAAGTLLLVTLHADGATAAGAVRRVIPTALGDALLALAVVPVVRRVLRTDSLRAAQPVLVDLIGSTRD